MVPQAPRASEVQALAPPAGLFTAGASAPAYRFFSTRMEKKCVSVLDPCGRR